MYDTFKIIKFLFFRTMNPNNHQKTLKIIEQLLMCTPYVFVKRLTEEDIHVMTT